jgi:hypothetical protein
LAQEIRTAKAVAAGSPEHMAEAKANAAFIERAVNAHDALVEALTEAKAALEYVLRGSIGAEDNTKFGRTIERIDSALGAK